MIDFILMIQSGQTSMNFTFNEDYVVGGEENSFGIVIWDARNGTFLKKLLGHSGKIRSFAASPTSDAFVSASEDSRVKYWDIE